MTVFPELTVDLSSWYSPVESWLFDIKRIKRYLVTDDYTMLFYLINKIEQSNELILQQRKSMDSLSLYVDRNLTFLYLLDYINNMHRRSFYIKSTVMENYDYYNRKFELIRCLG